MYVPISPVLTFKDLSSPSHSFSHPLLSEGKTFSLYSRGRNALWYGLKALNLSPPDEVLVPAFICADAIIPIEELGLQINYFSTNDDYTHDVDDIVFRINSRTKALLIVHYFGFPQQMVKIKKICNDHGLLLIEDCAHALMSTYDKGVLGSFGDVSFFSLRKFFPLPDGGALVINNPKFHLPEDGEISSWREYFPEVKNTLRLLDNYVRMRIGLSPLGLFRFLRGAHYGENSQQPVKFNQYFNLRKKIFKLSKVILRKMDIHTIKEKRKENFKFLSNALNNSKTASHAIHSISEEICPLAFPVRVNKGSQIQKELLKRGVETYLWPALPEKIARHTGEESKRNPPRTLLLPVHQNVGIKHLKHVVNTLNEILSQ